MKRRWVSLIFMLALPPSVAARDMQSDRPDKTEGPFTVEAWAQIEMDLVAWSREREPGAEHERLSLLPFNLKLGLTNDADAEFVVESFSRQQDRDDQGGSRDVQGFGDLTLRLKFNFWGQESGFWASGFIPFIKFPTNQNELGNHAVEGGLIFPQDLRLPGDLDCGTMAEFEFLADDDGAGRHAMMDLSLSLSHAIKGDLGGFVEYYSSRQAFELGNLSQSLDAGLSLQLGPNAIVDCGVNYGLPKGDSLDLFSGLSLRI